MCEGELARCGLLLHIADREGGGERYLHFYTVVRAVLSRFMNSFTVEVWELKLYLHISAGGFKKKRKKKKEKGKQLIGILDPLSKRLTQQNAMWYKYDCKTD